MFIRFNICFVTGILSQLDFDEDDIVALVDTVFLVVLVRCTADCLVDFFLVVAMGKSITPED